MNNRIASYYENVEPEDQTKRIDTTRVLRVHTLTPSEVRLAGISSSVTDHRGETRRKLHDQHLNDGDLDPLEQQFEE